MLEKQIPYVKRYDKNGVLENPIKGSFVSPGFPRRVRRPKRDRGVHNKDGVIITKIGVLNFVKYRRFKQVIGNKVIQHYQLK